MEVFDNYENTIDDIEIYIDELIGVAKTVFEYAYAPYSKCKIGCALLSEDGQIFSGCNVENISYNGTSSAEVVAITKAISEGVMEFKAILLYADSLDYPYPSGSGLQVLSEFNRNIDIILVSNLGVERKKLHEMLPFPYNVEI